jgi:prolyl-tRNA editing enzyme YbaK/EbsC (Cys-tRNA(Pro) deacylase)
MRMSSATDRVTAALAAAGVTGGVRILDSAARTAALAAEQLGVAVGAIANSLVFSADGEPLLIMTSGAHRVDTVRVAAALGVDSIGRADSDFVRRHTGQAIGGVAPVGHPAPIRTVVDRSLAQHERIWAAAGHPNTVFPTTYDELVRLTRGTELDVASDL